MTETTEHVVISPQSAVLNQAKFPAKKLAAHYQAVRRFSDLLCEPLEPEDCVIQSMPDASPTKWHLAHTTWFFETLVLKRFFDTYRPFRGEYAVLFNSYYNSIGKQFPRPRRGLLSRPTVKEVFEYRSYVDEHMAKLFDRGLLFEDNEFAALIEIGLNHEQQHQELILTDIKHMLGQNPLHPIYRDVTKQSESESTQVRWRKFDEGIYRIGCGDGCFSYDNERPQHRRLQESFEIGHRLITNAEFAAFMQDGGYKQPNLWLSEGWTRVNEEAWTHPLYWVEQDGQWHIFTLSGLRPLDPNEPVCHVSYFEADAFARWFGARLPSEAEWEIAGALEPIEGNFVESGRYHPACARGNEGELLQIFGDVWEWTQSPYTPYPGYRPVPGPLGEYNGKFMCNQYVLRGGSCATSKTHIRSTYRNFFPPDARWQFTGIRLARDSSR